MVLGTGGAFLVAALEFMDFAVRCCTLCMLRCRLDQKEFRNISGCDDNPFLLVLEVLRSFKL